MKALVYTGEKKLIYQDYNDPIKNKDEEIIKINSVGICGSDMHAFLGHDERRPSPLILGHEPSGVIVGGENDGKKVTINPLVTCGHCRFCISSRDNLCLTRQIISMPPREGAFAEYVSIPKQNLIMVPDEVSLENACLTEPLACGWHASKVAKKIMSLNLKELNCLVIGGGAIGIGATLSLLLHGAENIFLAETNEIRHNKIKKTCNVQVFNPEKKIPFDEGSIDLVIDGVGIVKTREMSSKYISPGGLIVHIGLGQPKEGLDIRRMTLQEITFVGTYTYTSSDFKETADKIFNNEFGNLDWVDIRPLKDGQACFEEILEGKTLFPKIILKP